MFYAAREGHNGFLAYMFEHSVIKDLNWQD